MLALVTQITAQRAGRRLFANVALENRKPSRLPQCLLRGHQPTLGSRFYGASPLLSVVHFMLPNTPAAELLLSRSCAIAVGE